MVRPECDVALVHSTTRRTATEQKQPRIRKVATLARSGEKGRAWPQPGMHRQSSHRKDVEEIKNRGNSQNLRNFPHASPGGWVGSQPPFVFVCLITRFHWCSPWPKCSADSTRFCVRHFGVGVCGNACQSSRVVCGNALPVMSRL